MSVTPVQNSSDELWEGTALAVPLLLKQNGVLAPEVLSGEEQGRGGMPRPFSLCGLPDGVKDGAIHPLNDGDRALACLGALGFAAADTLDFSFDVLNRPDRQLGSFYRVHQVFPQRIDGNATLGDDDINQFAGSGQSRHLIYDHRNAITE